MKYYRLIKKLLSINVISLSQKKNKNLKSNQTNEEKADFKKPNWFYNIFLPISLST